MSVTGNLISSTKNLLSDSYVTTSDLSSYVTTTTYNSLASRVTTLESSSVDTSNFYQKNASLIPSSNGSYSLGSSSYRFNYAYLNYLLVNSYVNSNLIPYTDSSYNLGSTSRYWANLYADTAYVGSYLRSTSAGYSSFANGMFMQWGRVVSSSSSDSWYELTFPVSFTAVYYVDAAMNNTATTSNSHNYIYSDSVSILGMTIRLFGSNSSYGTRYTYWLAIGRL